MVLSKSQYNTLFSDKAFKRHGLAKTFRHWPHGILPIKFDKEANFSPVLVKRITDAMNYIMNVSCIKFDWQNEPTYNYVFITRAERCSSMVKVRNCF